MLNIDKSKVDFLVTDGMVEETKYVISQCFEDIDNIFKHIDYQQINRVIFVACGSPLCACQTAKILANKYSYLHVETYSGFDFLLNTPYGVNRETLVIGVSDSGKTVEVVDSIKKAKQLGATTIGITKKSTAPLYKVAQFSTAYKAECIWMAHTLLSYYIVIKMMKALGHDNFKQLLADMEKLPDTFKRLIETIEKDMENWGRKASNWHMIYTIAAGNLLPMAYKEGVITMFEFTWTHGCALNAADFAHGPLEVVEDGVPYVFLLGNDDTREITKRAIQFVKRYSSDVFVFDVLDYVDNLHADLDPLSIFVPLEYFYYYLSIYKDHNPDDRRYYGGKVQY